MTSVQAVFDKRQAGILLHPTSLPGGVIGPDAYAFVDWLLAAGFGVWQMLPLGPVHQDRSPYQCLSAHAGDPSLISEDFLITQGWLSKGDVRPGSLIEKAFQTWLLGFEKEGDKKFETFVDQHKGWLHDFALFTEIRAQQGGAGWFQWSVALRDREPAALAQVEAQSPQKLLFIKFEQYVFFQQWLALKAYANQRGVMLFGDMPIFVAYDSADVWAHREVFLLDSEGRPTVVAGVPPDYFSATGQRWGNPLYDWPYLEQTGFQWWLDRFESQLELFDLMRIDHFRGFESYWEIQASCDTAMEGRWVEAPGDALFEQVGRTFGGLPLVAEDLGIITPQVEALRDKFALPGMKILQFAFGGDEKNPYLPHNHVKQSVCYTGTHDNNTTLGWYESLDEGTKHHVDSYLGYPKDMPWPLIHVALASVSQLSILPMQDVLGLGSEHRMNTPGTTENNWAWQFSWGQVESGLAGRLKVLLEKYQR